MSNEFGIHRQALDAPETGMAVTFSREYTQQMQVVELETTDRPVWPQDEDREALELKRTGQGLPAPMQPDEAASVLSAVRLSLPDQLVPWTMGDADSPRTREWLARRRDRGRAWVPILVPVAFSAPESITLRRLLIALSVSSLTAASTPLVVFLDPVSDVETSKEELGEVGADAAKIAALIPGFPQFLVAKVSKSLTREVVTPLVQAEGIGRSDCSWRVSSPQLAYGFAPWLLVQATPGDTLAVDAELHAEVRRSLAHGVVHRTYGVAAQPRHRHYEVPAGGPDIDGCSVDAATWRIVARARPEVKVSLSDLFLDPASTSDQKAAGFKAPMNRESGAVKSAGPPGLQRFVESREASGSPAHEQPDDDLTRLLLDEVTWLRDQLRTAREAQSSAEHQLAALEAHRPWWRRRRPG